VRWHPRYGYGVVDEHAAVTFDQIAPLFGASATPLPGGAGWRISGTVGDDVLDNLLDPERDRDTHLRGVPTSNVAMVEYRLGTRPWQRVPLTPAPEPHRWAFSFQVPGGAARGGSTAELRAWDTAGNVSPSLALRLAAPATLDSDAVP